MRPSPLTPRQKQVVQLIWEGLTNREIAKRLRIQMSTVEAHRAMIMTRLRVRNSAALLRTAIEQHIISVDY